VDANNTQFHLLLGKADWAVCRDSRGRLLGDGWNAASPVEPPGEFHWNDATHELTLQRRLHQFKPASKDRKPHPADRRCGACDRFGNIYWIDAQRQSILIQSPGSPTAVIFWPTNTTPSCRSLQKPEDFGPLEKAPPPQPQKLGALTVTQDHRLVVGMLAPMGLLIFDLHAGGAPDRLLWPQQIPFAPFDMAPRVDGGVWVLDRHADDSRMPARLWAFDLHFKVIPLDPAQTVIAEETAADFQPRDGGQRLISIRATFPSGLPLELESPPIFLDAIAIEALPDGTLLILHRGERFSTIHRYRIGHAVSDALSTEAMRGELPEEERASFTLVAHDFAYRNTAKRIGQTVSGRLYLADQNGNQAFAFDLSIDDRDELTLTPNSAYFPLRRFGGKGLVAANDGISYDFHNAWIPLVEQCRPRHTTEATLTSPMGEPRPAFDSRQPGCVWHRLMIDAVLPPDTGVQAWSRAADSERALASMAWCREPELYRRGNGCEIPFVQGPCGPGATGDGLPPDSVLQSTPSPSQQHFDSSSGTWELLFQQARGRYLQLKLTLTGNGRHTPRLTALRAYFPRFSYLEKYLPAVYGQDRHAASFLDRFLSNFEGLYTALEDKIAAVHTLIDVRSTPSEALEWLAGWFGLVLDRAWDDQRRRLLIKHAMTFFQYRGTTHGLQMALRLTLNDPACEEIFVAPPNGRQNRSTIRVVEKYRTRTTPAVVLGDPTEVGLVSPAAPSGRWEPRVGAAQLSDRYARYLEQQYATAEKLPASVWFPIRNPLYQKATAADPAASVSAHAPEDEILWQVFLQRRYTTIAELNKAHHMNATAFEQIRLPEELSAETAPFGDWNAFIDEKAGLWQRFCAEVLGFVPQAADSDARLWQDYLLQQYADIDTLNSRYGTLHTHFNQVLPPEDQPNDPARLNDWDAFLKETAMLATVRHRTHWQGFLRRRYRSIPLLKEKLGMGWDRFQRIPVPAVLPTDPFLLADWWQFEAVVLRMHDTSHRFTVLIPMPEEISADRAGQQQRLRLAERIIDFEKPAHTSFNIKFYWDMFIVGQARLGRDTVLDRSGRDPLRSAPMVLGQSYLSEGYLDAPRRSDADGRRLAHCLPLPPKTGDGA
jgi:phage tail-like protein